MLFPSGCMCVGQGAAVPRADDTELEHVGDVAHLREDVEAAPRAHPSLAPSAPAISDEGGGPDAAGGSPPTSARGPCSTVGMGSWTSPGAAAASAQEGKPRGKADLRDDLQDETMCSIMGYAKPRGPEASGPPMLLGRTHLACGAAAAAGETLSQVKNHAASARKQQALRAFLLKEGFSGPQSRKEVRHGLLRRGFTLPLHAAVAANDAGAVEVLLWGGADRACLDSQKTSPLALAKKLDRQGSHRAVISMLEG